MNDIAKTPTSMNTRIVILAAGKGKRMNAEVPKVLLPLREKLIIQHLLESVRTANIDPKPVIVIGSGAELVRKNLGEEYEYVVQEEQLGTGHAVSVALDALRGSDAAIVLYGDQPFISPDTITRLAKTHREKNPALTLMTTTVSDFEDWRHTLYDFGRIMRDEKGNIVRIVEKKDATEQELRIKEVNPSFFCFGTQWLTVNIKKLTNTNKQKEYYFTDLVGIAIEQGDAIASLDVNPLETIGVNTKDHLELAHSLD